MRIMTSMKPFPARNVASKSFWKRASCIGAGSLLAHAEVIVQSGLFPPIMLRVMKHRDPLLCKVGRGEVNL